MADLLMDNETLPSTPAAGKSIWFVDSTVKRLVNLDDAGMVKGLLSKNFSTASQGAGFAADTYVTNSGLLIPSFGLIAGMYVRWVITGSKTAAGVAQAVYTIRVGSGQATTDTSLLALTAGAQTAAADNGTLVVTAVFRSVGAGSAAVIAGGASWAKTQAGTAGLGGSLDGVSSGFDSTAKAGQFLGLSINGGASAAWTLTSVAAELIS